MATRLHGEALTLDDEMHEAVYTHYRELLTATGALSDLESACATLGTDLDDLLASLTTLQEHPTELDSQA